MYEAMVLMILACVRDEVGAVRIKKCLDIHWEVSIRPMNVIAARLSLISERGKRCVTTVTWSAITLSTLRDPLHNARKMMQTALEAIERESKDA